MTSNAPSTNHGSAKGNGGVSAAPAGGLNPLQRVSRAVTSRVDTAMYKLGHYTARHQCRVAGLAVLAVLVLACGVFIHFKYDNTGDVIWPPQESETVRNKHYVKNELGADTLRELVMFEVKDPNTNILDKAVLGATLQAAHRVFAVKAGDVTLGHICAKVPGTTSCRVSSILFHWYYHPAQLAADPDVINTVRNVPYPNGRPAQSDDVAGWNADFTAARAFRLQVEVDNAVAAANGVSEDQIKEWELALVAEVQSWTYTEFNSYVLAQRSMDDAITNSLRGDMNIVVIGVALMILYTYLVLTRRLNSVHSRFLLTAAAVAAVLLGFAGSTGLISAFGVWLTNLNQILIYVVMGIGVDDAFIIASCVDTELHKAREAAKLNGKPDPALPVPENKDAFAELCGRGLSKAASSIAFTSVTDLAAFWLGSFTRIPATSWFCLYAGAAVICVFLMQITLFSACLFADIQRQAAYKRDVVPCACLAMSPAKAAALKPVAELSLMQKFMKRHYAPVITRNRGVQAGTVLVFLGLIAAGAYGVSDIMLGFPVVDLTPDDHYTRSFLETSERYWPGFQYRTVRLLFKHNIQTANGATAAEQAVNTQLGMYNARHSAGLSKWIEDVPTDWWLVGFLQYAASDAALASSLETRPAPWDASATVQVWVPPSGVSWGDKLVEFKAAVTRFETHLALRTVDGVARLHASSCDILYFPQAKERDIVTAMQESRADVKAAASTYGVSASTYVYYFQFTEMDAISVQESIQNMILALVGVTIVSLLFLGNLKVTALVVFMVALIDLELLGSLQYLNIRLNSISVVNLVLSLGLCVDMSAHIAHRFLDTSSSTTVDKTLGPESAADRVERTLWVLGASVFNGGWSTLMAVLPLVLTSSTIFDVFFKMMTCIVLLGLAHGLVLLPVLLSVCTCGAGGNRVAVSPMSDDAHANTSGEFTDMAAVARPGTANGSGDVETPTADATPASGADANVDRYRVAPASE